MNINVSIRGSKELVAKLKRLSDDVAGKALENAVVTGALLVQNEAKKKAPVRTGNLRRSIHIGGHSEQSELGNSIGTDLGGNKNDRDHAEVLVGTNVEYAPMLEFGTSKMPPHPYLRPALDSQKQEVAREIGAALKILLGKI